eukprot:CAMPEP_0179133212 /NCGR_PEP_ID=MMETSP0796-20121207/63340_1 /TAXON_ID=73915 /ORGANISM="Pyrodinium bahamense, Strain pbaha01" /LENGTH=163 /DNA_ID=CAMNT_0020832169 /DNA_START=124 /DNA_END=615 /DNA_ORIENTATION=-
MSSFVPSPEVARVPARAATFSPAVAASTALPVLTLLAEDAEAKYGDARKWSAILVPLTTLVLPAVVAGSFVLYSFSEDAFYRLIPGSKKSEEQAAAWREHYLFANIEDPMDGFINKDDYEQGLEEAWEKAKPAGSTVTAKEKLKELSEQNAPHFWRNKIGSSA